MFHFANKAYDLRNNRILLVKIFRAYNFIIKSITRNDVNLVKLIFQLYIPKVVVKVFITTIKNVKKVGEI